MTRVTAAISVSADGYVAGPGLSADKPFGDGPVDQLHRWMFETPEENAAEIAALLGAGAYVMGRHMFGPGHGEWDLGWTGWWGPEPPYHRPVFVLTHHERADLPMEGGTTFHFVDASPAEALETAREAAHGQDVRIGGGPITIHDFLAAGLVDHVHTVVVPILLGRGVRLWDGLEDLQQDYRVAATSSPSGVTHVTFTRSSV